VIRAFALWLIFALPAAAQVETGAYPEFQTRHGLVHAVDINQFEQALAWNGQVLQVRDRWVNIAGAWALADSELDWVLVETNHGGNMCPSTFYLGRVDALGIALSQAFGECVAGAVQDLRLYPDRIEIDIPHPDIAVDFQTVAFDGNALTITEATPVLGDGTASLSDPRQWIGQHPVVALRDANEQARFLAVMPEPFFRQMVGQMSGPGAPVFERDGWVMGSACMAHQCNAYAAMWGIRLADGAPAAAILDLGGPTASLGAFDDPVFEAFYFAERARMTR